MNIAKYLLMLVGGLAPFAAMASLVGTFFGLGGWGWLLFLWFGFTGMFAAGAVSAQAQLHGAPVPAVGAAIVLVLAFAAGAAFVLSDWPQRFSALYALPVLLLGFLPLLLFRRK
jgi:hypothetical protein